jgi:hypothetical protein
LSDTRIDGRIGSGNGLYSRDHYGTPLVVDSSRMILSVLKLDWLDRAEDTGTGTSVDQISSLDAFRMKPAAWDLEYSYQGATRKPWEFD